MVNNHIKASIEFETFIDVTINKDMLTDELMDDFERYFFDLNDDSSYDKFTTRIEKHIAHIMKYVAMGNVNHLEGYGDISKIVIAKSDNEMYFNSDLELTEVSNGK